MTAKNLIAGRSSAYSIERSRWDQVYLILLHKMILQNPMDTGKLHLYAEKWKNVFLELSTLEIQSLQAIHNCKVIDCEK
jgi:hypothetical protein